MADGQKLSPEKGILLSGASFLVYKGLAKLLDALLFKLGQRLRKNSATLKAFGAIISVLESDHLRGQLVNWISTAVHALISSIGGLQVLLSTRKDIIHSSSPKVNTLAYHSLGYFMYDLIHLYQVEKRKEGSIHSHLNYFSYVKSQPMVHFHHFSILSLVIPVILFLRRGLGDCFVGLLFSMESSTLFVALRGVLTLLDLKRSSLYKMNYLCMTAVFFLVRILGVPAMYWLYADKQGSTVAEVVEALRWHCNAGSVGIMAFQSIWFRRMVMGCIEILTR